MTGGHLSLPWEHIIAEGCLINSVNSSWDLCSDRTPQRIAITRLTLISGNQIWNAMQLMCTALLTNIWTQPKYSMFWKSDQICGEMFPEPQSLQSPSASHLTSCLDPSPSKHVRIENTCSCDIASTTCMPAPCHCMHIDWGIGHQRHSRRKEEKWKDRVRSWEKIWWA